VVWWIKNGHQNGDCFEYEYRRVFIFQLLKPTASSVGCKGRVRLFSFYFLHELFLRKKYHLSCGSEINPLESSMSSE